MEPMTTALVSSEAEDRAPAQSMTPLEARAIAETIKGHITSARALLIEFDDRQGWRALGYGSWREWAAAELGRGQRYAYYELEAGRVEQTLLHHGANVEIGALPERRLRPLTGLTAEEQVEVTASLDLQHTTGAKVEQAVQEYRERREAKSHAAGWAERREQAVRATAERLETLPLEARFDRIERCDALTFLGSLPEGCVDLCVTSPPYWAKRTYDQENPDEVGQEPDPQTYVEVLRRVVGQIGRVLAPTGWLFLNLGDTYASNPGGYRGDPERWRGISDQARRVGATAPAHRRYDVPKKSLCLVPWRVLTALVQGEGWRCRNVIAWHKPNHLPENVGDRFTQAWEPVFALTRSEYPYFQRGAREGDLWAIAAGGDATAQGLEHPAPFPPKLVHRIIGHACPPAGVVLDPFAGSGTTLRVARSEGRRFLGCDLISSEPRP